MQRRRSGRIAIEIGIVLVTGRAICQGVLCDRDAEQTRDDGQTMPMRSNLRALHDVFSLMKARGTLQGFLPASKSVVDNTAKLPPQACAYSALRMKFCVLLR